MTSATRDITTHANETASQESLVPFPSRFARYLNAIEEEQGEQLSAGDNGRRIVFRTAGGWSMKRDIREESA